MVVHYPLNWVFPSSFFCVWCCLFYMLAVGFTHSIKTFYLYVFVLTTPPPNTELCLFDHTEIVSGSLCAKIWFERKVFIVFLNWISVDSSFHKPSRIKCCAHHRFVYIILSNLLNFDCAQCFSLWAFVKRLQTMPLFA